MLEPEQAELLSSLVEEARTVERAHRHFYLSCTDGIDTIHGPRQIREVLADDVYDLRRAGYLDARSEFVGGDMEFTISRAGFDAVDEAASRDPIKAVEDEITISYLESEPFQRAYGAAFQRWREAADLLWGGNAEAELTTIGHKTREAVQEFATALVDKHQPPDADPDPAHTVARLRAVIDVHRDRLGEARRHLLDALIAYWGEVNDLLQRQEHGGQKEGAPLTWEDGRRAVFQTAVVMFEIDRTL